MSSILSAVPSAIPTIRASKVELLHLLRDEKQRKQLSQNAASNATVLSPGRVGAIIGGIVGAIVLIGLIVVAIIVPLQRRRRFSRQNIAKRSLILLDDPLEPTMKPSQTGLVSVVGRVNPVRSGNARRSSSNSDAAGMAPLLERDSTGTRTPRPASSFSDPKQLQNFNLSLPPSLHYPSLSSTHMYQFPPPPSPLDQQNREDLYLYYQTASTTANGPLSAFVNGGSGDDGSGGRVEEDYDPYSPFADVPNPLVAQTQRVSSLRIDTNTTLARPAPALSPTSPKKATRDASFSHNTSSVNGAGLFFSAETISPSVNPFMTPAEAAPPTYNTATMRSTSTRSGSPQRPAYFSYHSTLRSIAGLPIPEFTNEMTSPLADNASEADTESLYSQMSLSRATTMGSMRGYSGMGMGGVGGGSNGSTGISGGRDFRRKMTNGAIGEMAVVPEGDASEENAVTPVAMPPASTSGDLVTPTTSPDPSPSASDLWPCFFGDDAPFILPFDRFEPVSPQPLESVPTSLARMDTLAIGNLIKSRAAKVRRESVLDDASSIERQSSEDKEPRVRGRGVGREEVNEAEQSGGGGYGQIARVPLKRTMTTEIKTKSRSNSRGRLIAKTSMKRAGDSDGSSTTKVEGGGSVPPQPIGASPAKFRPKVTLQQRLIEKGLLNVEASRSSTSLEEKSEVYQPKASLSSPDLPLPFISSASASPTKPYTELPQPYTTRPGPDIPTPKKANSNPLTGAFGLGRSPSMRSPATPTLDYAFADLEQTQPFLPFTAPLNLSNGPMAKRTGSGVSS